MTCTLLQEVLLEKQGSLKASQGVLPLSSDSVRQSSGLESENESYLTADGFFPGQNHRRTGNKDNSMLFHLQSALATATGY